MSTYSIKQLEKLSGIKAHTLRIWEQRYGLLTPERTTTNIRLYDDDQMRKLLNICTLLNDGLKISAIGRLSETEFSECVLKATDNGDKADSQSEALINQMISAGLSFNEHLFDKAFSSALLRYSLKETYIKIVYPMLLRVGVLWSTNDMMPSQEHFISNLIKQKLNAAIDAIPSPMGAAETWVLFLPEEEDHEIGLLLSSYLLRQRGKHVIYLGQRVPYSNLIEVIEETKPDFLHFFIVIPKTKEYIEEFVWKIKNDFPKISTWISASSVNQLSIILPEGFHWKNTVEEF